MTTITTAQLRALWMWARLSVDGGGDDGIALHTLSVTGNLVAVQGDRTAEWDTDGRQVYR